MVLAAFPGDAFNLDDLLPAGSVTERTEEMVQHVLDTAGRVTEMLTPEQRKTAADELRARASGSASAGGSETAETSAGEDAAETVSEGLWVGRGGYRAAGYRRVGAYGFSRTYASGFGGIYLL